MIVTHSATFLASTRDSFVRPTFIHSVQYVDIFCFVMSMRTFPRRKPNLIIVMSGELAGLIPNTQYPRDPGFFSSVATPQPRPTSGSEWKEFFSTSRGKPLWYKWQDNLRAGLTVSLVNIPLSISLSIAGGGTPEQGIISAFWAGAIASVFGGSHFNIVGPTGALSGILAAVSARHGNAMLPFLALYTSIITFAFVLFRIDKVIRYVPASVSHGFSIGVAVVLAAGQLGNGFGLRGLPPQPTAVGKIEVVASNILSASPRDAAFFIGQTVLLFQFMRRWPKIPWIIVFTVFGIVVGLVMPTGSFTLLNQQFPSIRPTLADPPTLLRRLFTGKSVGGFKGLDEMYHHLLDTDLIFNSFGAATVGLLETLLSARIANQMVINAPDGEALWRSYSSKRETFGLALSNFFTGIMGGIPSTAALARTALNVKSGAYNRLSAVLGIGVLAILSVLLLSSFEYIPASGISSILCIAAYRMIDFHEIAELKAVDRKSMFSVIFTTYCCITVDTFTGLIFGTSVVLYLHWDSYRVLDIVRRDTSRDGSKAGQELITLSVHSPLVFCNIDALDILFQDLLIEAQSMALPPKLVLDCKKSRRIDFDAVQLIGRSIASFRKSKLFSAVTVVNAGHVDEMIENFATACGGGH